MMKWIDAFVATMGAANLAFYAWGSHDPASLAVGIWCLFVALWDPRRNA